MKTPASIKKSSLIEGDGEAGQLNGKNIRIRMYRVGFGDCFLLSLPTANDQSTDKHVHILVDCGVHSQGDIGTMEKVVNNIGEVTDKKLAIIIATHAHQDHISGFGKFGDMFTNIKVGEVWLPWTWDEKNEKALKIQRAQAALTAQLFQHFEAQGAQADQNALNTLDNLNLKSNANAIALLKSGFGDDKARVRYLKAGDILKQEDIRIPGLIVRLLGPPESEEFLSQMDPPRSQRYLRMVEGQAEVVNAIQPFAQIWKVNPELNSIRLDKKEEENLRKIANFPLDDLAFALDQARNNESLVTLFIFHNQHLLFAGDAQYGNWRGWLENEEQSGDILSKINFFKIAHHGSHNATPKTALEGMSDGEFAAMVSTQSTPWNSIPRAPLMTRLSEKTRKQIVRSDWLSVEGAPRPLADAQPPSPSMLPKGFSKGDVWFDYVITIS
jgi:beta-lactamase superfamily II metal-dependent hydrolase